MAVALPFILGGAKLLGGIAETNVQLAQMNASANADEMNASASRQEGHIALAQSGLEEEALRKQTRQIGGEQRASIAQSGIGTGSSTGERLAVQSAVAAEQDALHIRYGGLLKHYGTEVKARQYEYQAKATRAQRSAVKASGYLGAVAGGLGGYVGGGGSLGGG